MSEAFEGFGGREERAAHNQSLFRAVNEQVRALNENLGLADDRGPMSPVTEWVCECANPSCMERIAMSNEEYTAVRSAASRFAVAPSDEHVLPDIELVVGRHPTYWVVEKTGKARVVAEKLDSDGA